MSFLLAATLAQFVPIASGDERLAIQETFVSEQAKIELSNPDGERVLCLDQSSSPSICLTKSEWKKSFELASKKPKKGPRPFIPAPFMR